MTVEIHVTICRSNVSRIDCWGILVTVLRVDETIRLFHVCVFRKRSCVAFATPIVGKPKNTLGNFIH